LYARRCAPRVAPDTISCGPGAKGISLLSYSETNSTLEFIKCTFDRSVPSHREADFEQEYYREISAAHSQNPVLKFIASLPTPMFLGLDRRITSYNEDDLRVRRITSRVPRLGRNIFSTSLRGSVADAASLAEERYRDTLIAVGRLGENLRQSMLLELLTIQPANDARSVFIPTRDEIAEISRMRRDVDTLAAILGLPATEVQKRVIPFLDLLATFSSKFPQNTNLEKLLSDTSPNDEVFRSLVNWNANKPQLASLRKVSKLVTQYNDNRAKLNSPTDKYLKLLNAFLEDSSKEINFDENGYIHTTIKGISDPGAKISLSSGEAQIFVIITNLAFGQNDTSGNVFIIDEPELSLHIRWQELFVDSIMAANFDVQFILATHSPSIILDRINKCIDLSNRG